MSGIILQSSPVTAYVLRQGGNVSISPAGAQQVVVPSVPPGAVGPQGPAGSGGSGGVRIDQIAASASWVLSHSLGRAPMVQVFLASGEAMISDIACTSSQISVSFASPTAGFVIAA